MKISIHGKTNRDSSSKNKSKIDKFSIKKGFKLEQLKSNIKRMHIIEALGTTRKEKDSGIKYTKLNISKTNNIDKHISKTSRQKKSPIGNTKGITENDINKTKTTNFQNNLNNNIKENLKQNKNTIKKSITNKENLNNNNIKEEIKKDKKENRKKEINIIKRNDNLNKEIFNINLRNNSVNNKGNKQRQNKENYKTHNINNEIKKENKTKNEIQVRQFFGL